jgi:hypothetical protein
MESTWLILPLKLQREPLCAQACFAAPTYLPWIKNGIRAETGSRKASTYLLGTTAPKSVAAKLR